MRSVLGYILGISIVAFLVTNLWGLKGPQIVSTLAFACVVFGAIFFWRFRVAFALAGVSTMLFLKVLTPEGLIKYAHMDVVLFLVGMMTVIAYLEKHRFFEYLLDKIMPPFSRSGFLLYAFLLVFSAFLAALVDEVTSILIVMALALQICRKYNLDPFPMTVATVMATNVGSSFTVVGNPIGVLIAFEGGLSFLDFLRNATPVGLAVLGLTLGLANLYWRGYVGSLDHGVRNSPFVPRKEEFGNMTLPWLIFLGTIGGLVIHHPLEEALHLPKNSLLLAVPLLFAGLSLFASRERAREVVEHIDWWTLLFFIFFFATVGTLAHTGVTDLLAKGVAETVETAKGAAVLLAWLSGWMSAFMDNILAVATLAKIVHGLEKLGIDVFASWWGVLFGGCYLGNLTMIGSTANIVAIGLLERRERRFVNFVDWLKPGVVIAFPQLLLTTFILVVAFF